MYQGGLDPFPAFAILALAGIVLAVYLTRHNSVNRLGWLLFVVYFSLLISVILFPLPINQTAIEYGRWRTQQGFGPRNNFTLFATINQSIAISNSLRQVGGNVLLFTPLGLLLPLWVPRWNWLRCIIAVAATAGMCEIAQLLENASFGFRLRSFDIDDIWLNFVGGLLGFLVTTCVTAVVPIGQYLTRCFSLASAKSTTD